MNPERPVALVHAAGLNHQNWNLPDCQGMLHVLAAADLYQAGEISTIFFAGGEYI